MSTQKHKDYEAFEQDLQAVIESNADKILVDLEFLCWLFNNRVELEDVVKAGVKMREKQNAYFKNRTQENLIASKQAEAAFDKAAKEALEN